MLGIELRASACPGRRAAPRRSGRRTTGRATSKLRTKRLGLGRAGVADVDADELRVVAELARRPPTTSGASSRHGAHHEPQTMTTTGLPRKSGEVERLAVEVLAGELDGVARGRRRRPSVTGAVAGDVALVAGALEVVQPVSEQPGSRRQTGEQGDGHASGPAAPRARRRRENGAVLVRDRDQVAGRLGVGHLTSRSSSKWNDVSEHSVHWRLRGSCRNDRFSAVQPGDPDRQLVGDEHRLVAARPRRGRRGPRPSSGATTSL